MALTPVQCATPRPIRLIFEHVDVTWKCSISASHAGRQDVAVAVMCSISTAVRYTSMRYFRRMHLELPSIKDRAWWKTEFRGSIGRQLNSVQGQMGAGRDR
jgi:hypothetical protein